MWEVRLGNGQIVGFTRNDSLDIGQHVFDVNGSAFCCVVDINRDKHVYYVTFRKEED